MLKSFSIILILIVFSCNSTPDPQEIIDRSIELAGGSAYDNFEMEFDFRGRHYVSMRKSGNFEYTRITRDSLSEIIDTYSNMKPFRRIKNGEVVKLPDSLSSRIENSINSVNYFVLLPNGLNDEAVNKSYLGEVSIKDKNYHKIQVTFDEQGGGKDFEDVFIYWINSDNYAMDYLAYKYFTNGGGLRFREAFNIREINGIRFSDYRNYKPKDKSVALEQLDAQFKAGELELLSLIETENIVVR
ncbi:MAG: hypothetical protein HKN00_06190 [Flavobacteriaceae bacterium]|nr:hypothetical protein [Bacteroidia bacterium]NNF74754.1 hypothetical protein [Flavobacteriaceae bacterium]NNK71829.1 hypothetical protein [Flavobacteriaceae bacterium]